MTDAAATALARARAAQAALAQAGQPLRSQIVGGSMRPALDDGDEVEITPLGPAGAPRGTVVAFWAGDRLMAHRVVAAVPRGPAWIVRGDALALCDRPVEPALVVGIVTRVRRGAGPWALPPGAAAPPAGARMHEALVRALAGIHLGLAALACDAGAWVARRVRPREA